MGDIHELKCLEKHFKAVLSGGKKAEFRRNDRGFKTGDIMVLNEVIEKKYSSLVTDGIFHDYEKTGRKIICLILDVTNVNDVYVELETLPQFALISFRVMHVEVDYGA
ncbi:DUF3850 domain-containing protein [Providencia sp. PROV255]|uniref:DUF3850 domain-containing protein n=1 Tax=Providencia sp. PROV255 TaxID=2949943 RepID=UPI00234BE2F6|nr:DUF3850 domain-containing protein [Providencia sp. PROV255]